MRHGLRLAGWTAGAAAIAGTATVALGGTSDRELRIGSNPVLGSGTLFAGLYNAAGQLTSVPQGATGLTPAQPFTGSIKVGLTFGQATANFWIGLGGTPEVAGAALIDVNNSGRYPGPTYPVPSGSGLPGNSVATGIWAGQINVNAGRVAPGSWVGVVFDPPFASDTYTAQLTANSGTFNASGSLVWTIQSDSNGGRLGGAGGQFVGLDAADWFSAQGPAGGPGLRGAAIATGGSAAGLPTGFFSISLTVTARTGGVPAGCNLADVTGIGGPPAGPDGLLTGDDFNAFIGAFAAGAAGADITGIGGPPAGPDGLVTGDDFNAFIGAFAAGCP